MLEEIRTMGFEAAELGHAVRYSLWPGVAKATRSKVLEIRSLHNFCPVPLDVLRPSPNCYQYSDTRPSLRAAAVKGTLETIRRAAELGAVAVVLHLGWAGPSGITRQLEEWYEAGEYLNRRYCSAKAAAVRERRKLFSAVWDRVKACLDRIVPVAVEAKVKLGVEIREDFEEFPNEEEMPEILGAFPSEVVGYWHDFGHAARKDFLRWHTHAETLHRFKDRLVGCHIHDCLPPTRDHMAVGEGAIDFTRLVPTLPRAILQVLEPSPRLTREQIIASRQQWNSFVATLD